MSFSFVTPWTVTRQAPLSMGFSRQEYSSGLPFSTPGYLPNPGIEPEFLMYLMSSQLRDRTWVSYVSALAGSFLTTKSPRKPCCGISASFKSLTRISILIRDISQVLSRKMYIKGFEQRKLDERAIYREVWAELKEPVRDEESPRIINRGEASERGAGFWDPQEEEF